MAARLSPLIWHDGVRAIDESKRKLGYLVRFLNGAAIGEGNSIEELAGAVTADMFIVGDVRDLLIQGTKYVVDGEADPIVAALAAIGVVTTVQPEIDWAASLLKIAKKMGRLGEEMVKSLVKLSKHALKEKDLSALKKVCEDVATIAKKGSPSTALRILGHAEGPRDLEIAAEFFRREQKAGLALHVTGREGLAVLKGAGEAADKTLVAAAKKGDRGLAWLRSGNRKLYRPHFILGLLKSGAKGNLARLIKRVSIGLDLWGTWIMIGLAIWTILEGWCLWLALSGYAQRQRSP